jgi:hypothetical protein
MGDRVRGEGREGERGWEIGEEGMGERVGGDGR